MKHAKIGDTLVPFKRRWHVIAEVDLAPLLADHAAVRRMCHEAEALADRLREPPSHAERCATADRIAETVSRHGRVTGTFLKNALAGQSLGFGEGVLARVLRDQTADAIHAGDVVEALRAEHTEPAGTELLGYMLRCLFEAQRRALDFQVLAVLTLAGSRLSREARLALEHVLERPDPMCGQLGPAGSTV